MATYPVVYQIYTPFINTMNEHINDEYNFKNNHLISQNNNDPERIFKKSARFLKKNHHYDNMFLASFNTNHLCKNSFFKRSTWKLKFIKNFKHENGTYII